LTTLYHSFFSLFFSPANLPTTRAHIVQWDLVRVPTPHIKLEPAHDRPNAMVLEDAPQQLTRCDILDEWPPEFDKPSAKSLWRWLDRAVKEKLVLCEGTGRRNDPHRYCLPERMAIWQNDPIFAIVEEQRRQLNLPFHSLREKKQNADPE
jgi:hypothetical protein